MNTRAWLPTMVFVLAIGHTIANAETYDGEWYGTTDQGYEVGFIVSDDVVSWFIGTAHIDDGFCWSSTEVMLENGRVPIVGASFTITDIHAVADTELEFVGTFTSGTVCVGTWSYFDNDCGAWDSGIWQASKGVHGEGRSKLTTWTGGPFMFGSSVSISGDYAIVGTPMGIGEDLYCGAAYVFKRHGTTWWAEQDELIASDGAADDEFGFSVCISGDYAIVGASGDDNRSGSAYIFRRDGTDWNQQAKLTAADRAEGDDFGRSVCIDGDYAIVGAAWGGGAEPYSGAAYVFERNGATWTRQAKLTPGDGAEGDGFGCSVCMDGDCAIVGAHWLGGAEPNSGAAYMFRRSGTTWAQQAKLTASDAADYDYFGLSVSMSGDYAVIGAPCGDGAGEFSGSAYVFKCNGTTWAEQAKLTAADGADGDYFGNSVSIAGDRVVIGAPDDDDAGGSSGSTYVFRRNGTTWTQSAKLTAPDGAEGDYFGSSVSVSGDYALIGAPYAHGEEAGSGAAYVEVVAGAPLKAVGPSPSDGATNQSITVELSWSDGGRATSYDVYFGTNPTPGSGEYKGEQSATTYDPGSLAYGTTYYWRIDAKNLDGITTGDIWFFAVRGSHIVFKEWVWVSGSDRVDRAGIYGTKGLADPANIPGARSGGVSWTDISGNLWLFGGWGLDGAGQYGNLNGLWRFDGRCWTWVGGSDTADQAGVYGTKGLADPANVPGPREGSVSWTDSSGNLWLFGGWGVDGAGWYGSRNDLWKFDGANWVWVSGSRTADQPGVFGTRGLAHPANVPGARSWGVSWTDSGGNFWLFGGGGFDGVGQEGGLNDLWKYDGTSWTWVSGSDTVDQAGTYGTKGLADPANVPSARGGGVSWTDSGGNFWLFGGWGLDSTGTDGALNDLWKFDGANWTWVGGSKTVDQPGIYGTKGLADPTNVPGARAGCVSWTDSSGCLLLFGGYGAGVAGEYGSLNDLWGFDGTNWKWLSGSDTVDGAGVYGTRGLADFSNVPGAREVGISWTDNSGNLWLFGGWGTAGAGSFGLLNDLWKAETSSDYWKLPDFDGDGKSDLLWRQASTRYLFATLMDGPSTDGEGYLGGDLDWQIVTTPDFDGDGKSDLLLRQVSTGHQTATVIDGLTPGSDGWLGGNRDWPIVATPDFNGDGKSDLLWRQVSTGQHTATLMDGVTMGSSGWLGGSLDWQIVATPDFNGDGKADLLWRQVSTGQHTATLMDGLTMGGSGWFGGSLDWQIVATPDFNGDGQSDLLWRQVSTGYQTATLMNGLTGGSTGWLGGSLDWQIVATPDFNGDGKSDLLWHQISTGYHTATLMDGLAAGSSGWLGGDLDWHIVAAPDFNGDVKSDLLWRQVSTGDHTATIMDGLSMGNSGRLGGDLDWQIVPTLAKTAAIMNALTRAIEKVIERDSEWHVPADLNGDSIVDMADLAVLASQWRRQPDSPSADIAPTDGDGIIDARDLALMADYWLAETWD